MILVAHQYIRLGYLSLIITFISLHLSIFIMWLTLYQVLCGYMVTQHYHHCKWIYKSS